MLDNDEQIKVSANLTQLPEKKIIARKTRKSHCYSRK